MSCCRSPTMSHSQLSALEYFNCESDPESLGVRWEKWKRAFEIYLLAANILDCKTKGLLFSTWADKVFKIFILIFPVPIF